MELFLLILVPGRHTTAYSHTLLCIGGEGPHKKETQGGESGRNYRLYTTELGPLAVCAPERCARGRDPPSAGTKQREQSYRGGSAVSSAGESGTEL